MIFYEGIFLRVLGRELNGKIAGNEYSIVFHLEGNVVKLCKTKKDIIIKMI